MVVIKKAAFRRDRALREIYNSQHGKWDFQATVEDVM
jgi:hypothetical protein